MTETIIISGIEITMIDPQETMSMGGPFACELYLETGLFQIIVLQIILL
jgi:hypothetical protein